MPVPSTDITVFHLQHTIFFTRCATSPNSHKVICRLLCCQESCFLACWKLQKGIVLQNQSQITVLAAAGPAGGPPSSASAVGAVWGSSRKICAFRPTLHTACAQLTAASESVRPLH